MSSETRAIIKERNSRIKELQKEIADSKRLIRRLEDDLSFWQESSSTDVIRLIDIRKSGLPKRVANLLYRRGYECIECVLEADHKTIFAIKGIGPTCETQLLKFLEEHNIFWEPDM